MYKTIILIVIVSFSFSCNKKIKSEGSINTIEKEELCLTIIDRAQILEKILTEKRINKFLHVELADRNPLKVIKSEHFNDEITITNKDFKVTFASGSESYKDLLDIKLLSVDCNKKVIKFIFFSKIENVVIKGTLYKEKNWNIEVESVVEL